ncbi:MAG: hypothetical protein ACOX0W_07465 [Sphaerochaetaceae bacterium]
MLVLLLKKHKYLLFIATTLILFSVVGCVHTPLFTDDHYFQALGKPGQFVITVDTTHYEDLPKELQTSLDQLGDLQKRVERISFELYDPHRAITDFDQQYHIRGAIEGRLPKNFVNASLKKWSKVKTDSVTYYYNNDLRLGAYSPQSNLVLFSSDDFSSHYESTITNREKYISDEYAHLLQRSVVGLYAGSPQVMVDIGLNIPKSVIIHSNSLLLMLHKEGDTYQLSGIIEMQDEKLASSLSILVKSSYISQKRRNKEPLGDLTSIFVEEGNRLYINNLELSEEQSQTMFSLLTPAF